jgi:glycosyltransferase involved in cell wall biosynthesis
MLSACLETVLPQLQKSPLKTSLVVVENSAVASCGDLVIRLQDTFSSVGIKYLLEPDLGIPFARNTAVHRALQLQADWIVFIDDDEEAYPDWFEKLTGAIDTWDADVFHAPTQPIYPPHYPVWMRTKQFQGGDTGSVLSSAATGNTLARSWLFTEHGLGLRFDTDLRFTGGSDVELFSRATQKGATIRWIGDAIVTEHVPEARLTPKWLLQRAQRNAANTVAITRKERGHLSAILLAVSSTARLAVEAVGAAVILLFNSFKPETVPRHAFRLRTKLAKIKGYLMPLLGLAVEPYKNVEGR